MNKCRCGCGQEVEEGKQFLKGHWSKFNAQKKAEEPKQEAPKPEEPKQAEEPRITVSNIRACGIKSENVAWFRISENEYDHKDLEFFCTITNEKKEFCDYVAVVIEDGSIVPVILIPGFIGVHPRYYDPEEHKNEEKQPEPTEIRETKILLPQQKPVISQPDDPINNAIEELRKISTMQPEKKKGFIERMLGNAT